MEDCRHRIPVEVGDAFFIPYGAGAITLEPKAETVLLLCNPAGVDDGESE